MSDLPLPTRFADRLEQSMLVAAHEAEVRSTELVRSSPAYQFARGRAQGLSDASSMVRVQSDEIARSPLAVLADKCFTAAQVADINTAALLIEVGNALDRIKE